MFVPRAFASTQIILIPKNSALTTFSYYRPISLYSFISKVFTWLLTTRLSPLLPKLLSPKQAGFLAGRDIHDNTLLALELVNSLDTKTRGHNIIAKLDMSKAFDRVSWPLLQVVLLKFGFP